MGKLDFFDVNEHMQGTGEKVYWDPDIAFFHTPHGGNGYPHTFGQRCQGQVPE